jgi:hypothetical protein
MWYGTQHHVGNLSFDACIVLAGFHTTLVWPAA